MQRFKFNDEVHDYQRFVRENINAFGNMLLISEQLYIQNKGTCIIDILLLNKTSKRLVVLELKNVLLTDKGIWQPVKYYDYLIRAEDSLKQLLIQKQKEIDFSIDEIDFNPEIIMVVPEFDQQLLRSLSYVNSMEAKIIKLNLFIDNGIETIVKEEYKPSSIYHKEDLTVIKEKVSKVWNFEQYLKEGVDNAKINLAKMYIAFLKNIFTEQNKKLDMFFHDKYISLTVDGKVWGYIYIKKQVYQSSLDISFKTTKYINPIDFQFAPHVLKYKTSSNKIEICFHQIPQILIKKYML